MVQSSVHSLRVTPARGKPGLARQVSHQKPSSAESKHGLGYGAEEGMGSARLHTLCRLGGLFMGTPLPGRWSRTFFEIFHPTWMAWQQHGPGLGGRVYRPLAH